MQNKRQSTMELVKKLIRAKDEMDASRTAWNDNALKQRYYRLQNKVIGQQLRGIDSGKLYTIAGFGYHTDPTTKRFNEAYCEGFIITPKGTIVHLHNLEEA